VILCMVVKISCLYTYTYTYKISHCSILLLECMQTYQKTILAPSTVSIVCVSVHVCVVKLICGCRYSGVSCQYACCCLYYLNPVYTIQPVFKPVVQPGCQTGCTTRFDNRVERTAVRSTGCQTGFYNRFDNGFDNRLYRVYKHLPSCQTRLTTGLTTGCIV